MSDADILRKAPVAFVGIAQSQRDVHEPPQQICRTRSPKNPECGKKVTTFRVTDPLRGSSAPEVSVLSDDSCYCLGPSFRPGTTYLVVAHAQKPTEGADLIAASACQGTGPLDDRARRLARAFQGPKAEVAALFPLSIQTLRELGPTNTRAISFEESGAGILVTVTDRHGDAHVHKLEHDGASREEALKLLRRKQAELHAAPQR